MSKIKLPHSGGNSMSIGAPATNPSGDLELKLPATIGTAGQVLKNSSTPGTLEFGDDANDYVKLQTVAGGSTINNLTVDNLDTSVYRAFQLIGGVMPGDDAVNLNFYWRVSGSDCVANKYDYGQTYTYPDNNSYVISKNDQGRMEIMESGGNGSREGFRFNIFMFPYRNGDANQIGNFCTWQGIRIQDGPTPRFLSGQGLYDVDNIYPDGFKLQTTSGQMNDYNYSLYGIKR